MQRKEGFELRDLLMEEEVVQEAKANNQELLTYLCKRENLKQLISHAILFPTELSDTDAVQK